MDDFISEYISVGCQEIVLFEIIILSPIDLYLFPDQLRTGAFVNT
jgi:hypothetical protein